MEPARIEYALRLSILDILKYQGDMLPSQVAHRTRDIRDDSEFCKNVLVQLVKDGLVETKPVPKEFERLVNQYDDLLYATISRGPSSN